MKFSGTGLVGAVPAVTVASIVAEALTTSLHQPDCVSFHPGEYPSVSLQFSKYLGEERFGYVREWAERYGVPLTDDGRYRKADFSVMGVEFSAWAPADGEGE